MSKFDQLRKLSGTLIGHASPREYILGLAPSPEAVSARIADRRRREQEAMAILSREGRRGSATSNRPPASVHDRVTAFLVSRGRSGDAERWRLSIHEAGHAVVGLLGFHRIFRIQLEDDGSATTYVETDTPVSSPRLLCAGAVAERLEKCGRDASMRLVDLPFHDAERESFLAACRSKNVDAQASIDATVGLLKDSWRKVERIAGQLSLASRINYEELKHLMAS